ncbi:MULTISPECIES: hypothetical protein [unclassified Oceanobacillus]|nr:MULTISPECIES: hypothetical protein [unclassified Oceanobacillus]MBT2601419.1 hypothetical protein [Oceanobacillus sp. ISL-74]MBT2653304.1 hypothetical protein [Oceanobacillus sp. ISL-73]
MGLAAFNRMRRLQAEKQSKEGENNAKGKAKQGNQKGQKTKKKQEEK